MVVWAHDSSGKEGQALPSAPTMGHGGWCLNGLLMVPASSMHGGSHQAQVAGATGKCLHAWALRKSVSAQCTPTPRRRTAWQGMGCEHGARPYTQACCALAQAQYTAPAPAPPGGAPAPRPASHPMDPGAQAVHKCSAPQARKLHDERSSVGAGPSNGGPALLSLTVRKNGQPHFSDSQFELLLHTHTNTHIHAHTRTHARTHTHTKLHTFADAPGRCKRCRTRGARGVQ